MQTIKLKILTVFILLLIVVSPTYAQTPDTTLTKKEFRQQKRALKRQAKEQLTFKSDSIKISAMLQLRNTHEAKHVDSLKRVMKNSKELAKEAILESKEVKAATKALDPYLTHYKQYKSKLKLDSTSRQTLINEGKTIGLKELNKNEEYKALTNELNKYKGNPR